jgi:hypothetical protein
MRRTIWFWLVRSRPDAEDIVRAAYAPWGFATFQRRQPWLLAIAQRGYRWMSVRAPIWRSTRLRHAPRDLSAGLARI